MTKRKRSEQSATHDSAGKPLYKKRKHRHSTIRRTKSPSFKLPPSGPEPGPAATPSTARIAQTKDEGTQSVFSQPPPGLSKGQRRRWRRSQRRSNRSGDDENDGGDAPKPTAQKWTPSKDRVMNSQKPLLDRSTLLKLATTRLIPRVRKVWSDDAYQRSGTEAQGVVALSTANMEGAVPLRATVKHEGSRTVKPQTETPVATLDAQHEEASGASISRAESTPSIGSQSPPSVPHILDVRARREIHDVASGVRFRPPHLPAISFTRPAAGRKPNSVPSHTTNTDVQAAFRRFTAFVSTGDSDESDEESGSSESESDDERPLPRLVKQDMEHIKPAEAVANTAQSLEDVSEDSGADDAASAGLSNSESRSHHFSSKRTNACSIKDNSPLDTEPKPTNKMRLPNPPGPYPAATSANESQRTEGTDITPGENSFLGLEAGGIRSENGSLPPAAVTKPTLPSHPDPFAVSEADIRDALDTVEEVSKSILTTTRPLPASKSNTWRDPRDVEGACGLMDLASSSVRVSKLPCSLVPFRSFDGDRITMPMTIVCNAAHVVEDHSTTEVLEQLRASQGTDLRSLNDDSAVEMTSPDRTVSDSSSLSELSRTPTPPITSICPPQTLSTSDNQKLRHGDGDDTDEIAVANPLPVKKRKMTGRTSKHFTPQKQAKRKISAAALELELASSTDFADTEADESVHGGMPRAEKALMSMFRAEKALQEVRTPSPYKLRERQGGERSIRNEDIGKSGAVLDSLEAEEEGQALTEERPQPTPAPKKKRKSTGKKSTYFTPPKPALDLSLIDRVDLYNTTSSGRKARVPAGTSTAPVPSIHSPYFGIIQEKLWREPFWLLIAVTFLNKTTGRAAVPVFWALKEKYGTPTALAEADEEELRVMIHHLGLQTQRSRRLVKMAKAWEEECPTVSRRWRVLHYPCKGDGKELKKKDEPVEEDADECAGAIEIGKIPGCGPYAWDSWRIFCRDVLRGVAEDYNGKGAVVREDGEKFVPEWKKVLPLDKELRACLRWMWLREGWIWDPLTGKKRAATDEEMEKAVKGEMEIEDPQERKFAAQAAGVEVTPVIAGGDHHVAEEITERGKIEDLDEEIQQPPKTPLEQEASTDEGSNIVVTPSKKLPRRSRRLTASNREDA